MIIRLSREGVFPITTDVEGRPLQTATGLPYPGTIQGEGGLAGVPSLFVRLQGCNLRCRWTTADGRTVFCDTAHTWDATSGNAMEVDQLVRLIGHNTASLHHVVVTGGEPMLQPEALAELLEGLHGMGLHTTVETNGSIADPSVARHTDLMSISPKLSSSDNKTAGLEESVGKLVGLTRQNGGSVQLKFVIATEEDESEIKERFSESLSIVSPHEVIVMPMGVTQADLRANGRTCLDIALRNGWRFGPRLHIDLFGNREGT